MSEAVKKNLTLSQEAVSALEKRMQELSAQGVKAEEKASGELNISGCASGSCMAWA